MRMYNLLAPMMGVFLLSCHVVAMVSFAIFDFGVSLLKTDYGVAWRFISKFAVSAFQTVGLMKPEYHESYDSHGLSLAGMPPHL